MDFSREAPTGIASARSFLQRLKGRAGEAFLAVRALALSLGPDVTERVENGSVSYLRRAKPFLVLETSRSKLLAVFPHASNLPDPGGRLLRRGDERYAPVESPDKLDAHLQEFIRRAYSAAR